MLNNICSESISAARMSLYSHLVVGMLSSLYLLEIYTTKYKGGPFRSVTNQLVLTVTVVIYITEASELGEILPSKCVYMSICFM